MTTAWICSALLGLLVFGLGARVSMVRGSTQTNYGFTPDPADPLYKVVRAHGNATEYAPMLAILMLMVGTRSPSHWMAGAMILAVVSRYAQAAGMITCRSLAEVNALRAGGAAGTYAAGFALVVAALLRARGG